MNRWQHTVRFTYFWHAEIPIEEKAKCAAKQLEPLRKYFPGDMELDDIIDNFNGVSGDGEPPETSEFTVTEDFDARMYELYEWADANQVLVET